MKHVLVCIYLMLLLSACQQINFSNTTIDNKADHNCVIKNVTLVNLEENRTLAGQSLLIQNGVVVKIAPVGTLEAEALVVIDGGGNYVMQGLADMHVHLPSEKIERQRFLIQHLLAGVTYVRSMRGEANHISLRQAIQKGKTIGPDLYLASQPIRKNLEMTIAEVDSLVSAFKTTGYDAIKILSLADSMTFEALVAASKKYDLPLCGHISSNIGLTKTLESETYTSIEHLGGYFKLYAQGKEVLMSGISATSEAGVYNCATLDFYTASTRTLAALEKQAGVHYATDKQKKAWKESFLERQQGKTAIEKEETLKQALSYKRIRLELIKSLYEVEVPLLLSPDATGIFAVPGFSLLRELKLHEEAGIPYLEVLKMATQNAAKFVGETTYGGIQVGQKANFIVLEKNPLSNLNHLAQVRAVYCNGQWHTKQQLEQQLMALEKH